MGLFEFNDVGIDLGTASVLVYVRGKGIVLREPSVVAVEKITGKILAIGEEARRMLGRTPGNILAMRPLRDGVISNYDITERLLNHFLRKVVGRRIFFKPRVVVCVPSGVTEVEKRSVIDATEEAGARHTYLIEEPIAAAIGAGIDIAQPRGNMILDIGGGTSDVAILSLGGAVLSDSIKIAGDKFDEAIVRYMRKKHNLLIGERTAEEMKTPAPGPGGGLQRDDRRPGGTLAEHPGERAESVRAHPSGIGQRHHGKRHLPHRRRRPALRHGQVHFRAYQGALLRGGGSHLLRGHRHGQGAGEPGRLLQQRHLRLQAGRVFRHPAMICFPAA